MPTPILFQEIHLQRTIKALIFIIAAGVLIIDFKTPLGVTSGSAYIICVFLCYWVKERYAVFIVAAICCILLMLDFIFSPPSIIEMWMVVFNRIFAIMSILLSAAFTHQFKSATVKHLENELVLSSTLESASEVVLVVNREGDIVYANNRTKEIFGFYPAELKGKKVEILVPEEVREKHVRMREQYAQNPTIRHMGTGRELEAVRKDHSRFPVEISLGFFNTHKGFFVTCFITDISARKGAEKALKQSNIELDETIQKLKSVNLEKEQFLYATSHEMQEPIRMIASYAQLLEKKCAEVMDAEKKQYLDIINNEAKRMKQLLVAVSEYININEQGDEDEKVDCNAIVKEVKMLLHQELEQSKAQLLIENELPVVTGNKTQLLQLFTELIENAVKFKSNTPPQIRISCAEKENVWEFCVADNGISIDPKYADRIFKIFKKLHNYNEYQGTGMGLAIAHKVIYQHGGEIWYESVPDKGTTFHFTLPK